MAKKAAKKNVKKKGMVMSVIQESSVKEYFEPPFQKVATEITADESQFIPEYNNRGGNSVVLKTKNSCTMPHRATAQIDCGFSMNLKTGWKATVTILPIWAEKGLIITNSGVLESGRVGFYVTNVGKQIIVLQSEEEVAKMTIEPLYLFEWVVK